MLARQTSSLDQKSDDYTECMETVRRHVAVLQEAGLDFKDFVGVGLLGKR